MKLANVNRHVLNFTLRIENLELGLEARNINPGNYKQETGNSILARDNYNFKLNIENLRFAESLFVRRANA